MPKITLVFSDAETVSIEARAGEMVLQAAKRNGIALSSDCEVGDCQTCRANLLCGKIEYDEYATVSLTQDEMQAGEMLSCVSAAETDVTVELPYERAALIAPKRFVLKVQETARLGSSVIQLKAQSLGVKPMEFLPGQYINLNVPGTDQWRSYSMATPPSAGRNLELLVRLLDAGEMSDWLRNRTAVGDMIECNGPFGTFYLREHDAPLLMIAGGTGVAPMISMLRVLEAGKSQRRIVLCFGVNRPDELFYVDELLAFRKTLPNYELRIALVEAGPDSPYKNGYCTDQIAPEDVRGSDIYLCGPPAMTDAAAPILASNGADPRRIFMERFVSSSETPEKAPALAVY